MGFEGAFNGIGRQELEQLAAEYLKNLTAVQERCTQLLTENRELRAAWVLTGWTCQVPTCGVFNGAAKEMLTECRCCGTPRDSGRTG